MDNIEYIFNFTPLQEGILFHKFYDETSTSYFLQKVFSLNGKVNMDAFNKGLQCLATKHDILRAIYVFPKKSDRPLQVILREKKIELNEVTVNSWEEVEELKAADIKRGFDLSRDSLLRVTLIHLSETEHAILWSSHHIIMDGWCLSIVFGDFMSYYNRLATGESYGALKDEIESEAKDRLRFCDYVSWIEKQSKKKALDYWGNLLDGYDKAVTVPPLQSNKNGKAEAKTKEIFLDKTVTSNLKKMATEHHVTLNTVVEAAWGILLQKYNYCDDVVFGKIVSGRNAELPGIEQAIGLYINTIPSRVAIKDGETVGELVVEMQEQALASMKYEYSPLTEIQSRSLVGRNLIQTLFIFENYYIDEEALNQGLVGLNIKLEDSREEVNYAMAMTASVPKDELSLNLMYDASIYTAEEAERVLRHLEKLLEQMSVNHNVKVSDLEIVTDLERDKIFNEFNDTKAEFPEDKTVVDLFEEQVEKMPDKIAIMYGDESITYAKLNEKANQLAHKLQSIGVKREDFVAIMAKRSIEMIVGIIGILKAGGAYVPIDPDYPDERINYIISDCNPKAIVTYGTEIKFDGIPKISLSDKTNFEGISVNPEKVNTPNDLIYVIYTSGTTGKPKGVMIEHHNVTNFISINKKNKFQLELINKCKSIYSSNKMVFDITLQELFLPICNGKTIILSKDELDIFRKEEMKSITEFKPTGLIITPTKLKVYMDLNPNSDFIKQMSVIMIGAERLDNTLIKRIQYENNTIIYNGYGPTETTCGVLYYKCNNKSTQVPIGKPISNTKIYILNGKNLCGIGMPGELCIAGEGLARGYLNRPELTSEKFVDNIYGTGKMYRTGDLARWLEDGNIEYLGRMDDQVKIRGFRIELGEIECRLREIENVRDCTVVDKADMNGDKAICAYIVSDQDVDIRDIKLELAKNLPEYMIPAYIMQIEKIPVTINGKLDRRALPDPEFTSVNKYAAPETDEQKAITEAFEEILGAKKVGIDDDFFEMGGDSIKAIRVVSKMREKGYDMPVKDIILYRTARIISGKFNVYRNDVDMYEQCEVTGKVKLTPIQQEFFHMDYKKPDHFNQALMLKCKEPIDCKYLEATLKAVTSHHDVLRSVYDNGEQKILSVADSKLFMLSEYDIKDTADYAKKITEICGSIQESLSVKEGPLFKAALFHTAEDDYVFLCNHHLIIDGISWRVLLEDIENAYSQAREGNEIKLPRKTQSYKAWSENLSKCTKEGLFDKEVEYWDKISEGMKEGKIFTNLKEVQVTIDEENTEHFLKDCTKAFGTEINDLLLTALGQAYKKLTGDKYMTVDLEAHGREVVGAPQAIDRTVGWFTSIYPVKVQVLDEIEESIMNTKETLRNIPNHGIGYGALAYLSEKNKNNEVKKSDICFNYLGDFESEERNLKIFSLSDISFGKTVAVENGQTNAIAVFGGASKGKMTFTVSYAADVYSEVQMDAFNKDFKEAIEEVITTCMNQNESVADYGLKFEQELVSQQEKYITNYEHNECVYTYSPLLLQSFFVEDHTNNITKFMHINEPAETLQKALLKMVENYGSLRTRYNTETKMLEEYDFKEWNIPIMSGKGYDESLIINSYLKTALNIDLIGSGKLLSHITVVDLSARDSLVLFTVHHAIWDRMSGELFEDVLNDALKGNKLTNYSYAEYCNQIKENCEKLKVTDKDNENMSWITDKNVMLPFEKAYSPGVAIQFKYALSKEENELISNKPIDFSSKFLSAIIQNKSSKYTEKEPIMIAKHNRNYSNSNILGMVLDVTLSAYDECNETLLSTTSDTEYIMEKYVNTIQIPNIKEKIFTIPTINYTGIMATDETFLRNNSHTLEVDRITGLSMKGILLECSVNEGFYHGAIVGIDCSYDEVLKAINEAL